MQNMFTKFIFIVLIFMSQCLLAKDKNYFVSPMGADSNPGTLEKPFKTIERARDVVRRINQTMKQDIVVYLRGGTYQIDRTIEFDQRDSGREKHRIVYQAWQDEKPVISGGVQITGWQPHENGIWKAPAGDINFRQLYINGKRAIRARTPNTGYFQDIGWDLKAKEILVTDKNISKWNNFKQAEIVVHMNWAEAVMRLESFTLSNTESSKWHAPVHAKITVQEPERSLVFARDYPPKRNNLPYYFTNAYELLDAPGEWYLDRTAQMLYYQPHADEDMSSAQVIVPKVETLLSVQGTLDHPVKNIVFKGITFMHSTWLRPSEKGALNIQACNYTIHPTKGDYQFVERCKAAVYVEAAHQCVFEFNRFQNLGAVGIDFHYGTKQCVINANVFQDIAASGIQLAKFSDPDVEMHLPYLPKDKREICVQDRITNNYVSNIGLDYVGAIGIACGQPREVQIIHNEVCYTPYTGISVGWGWRSFKNAMQGNVINQNHIHHVCQIMCDCGGIYTLSAQPESQIVENYIHHVEHSPWAGITHTSGIYLDAGSAGFFIADNMFRDLADRKALALNGECVVRNNRGFLPHVVENAGISKEYKQIIDRMKMKKRAKLKHIVMTTKLKNNAEAIEKYKYYHSAEGVWPEVIHAAKQSGIHRIKIYLQGNRLMMILTIPEDMDIDEMNKKYAASSTKIGEWAKLMSQFQQAPAGANEGELWVPMELIHDYVNGMVK